MAQSSLLVLRELARFQKNSRYWTCGKSQHLLNHVGKYLRTARVDDTVRLKNIDNVLEGFAAKNKAYKSTGVKAHYAELTRAINAGYSDIRKYYKDGRPYMTGNKQTGGPGTKKQ